MPRRRVLWPALYLVLLLPLLAGCSGSPWARVQWKDQERLHLPHLQWLAGLSRLPDPESGSGGSIASITTFRQAGDGTPQVLVSQNGILHVVGLDERGDHQLKMGGDCHDGTVTPDGRWVGCRAYLSNIGEDLQLAALHEDGTVVDAHRTNLSGYGNFSAGMWSQDGLYLATVIDNVKQCEVAVLASSPPYSHFTPTLRLTSDAFFGQRDCEVRIAAWSDDGSLLRLVSGERIGTPVMDDVDIRTLMAASNSMPTVDIPFTEFRPIGNGRPIDVSGWYPAANMFVYRARVNSLQGIDPSTGKTRSLVTIPAMYPRISNFTWTVDGSQILLVVDGITCVDCWSAYRSDVYLYTP